MASVPGRGAVVWMDFGPRQGHEQGGFRPALVLSPSAYNRATGLALACPITSKKKGYPFEVDLPPGGKVQGVVLSDHVKSIDWRAHGVRAAGVVPEQVVRDVVARIAALLSA